MISTSETVWRHILVAHLAHDRSRWPSVQGLVDDLATVSRSTVHHALHRPVEIGAVHVLPGRHPETSAMTLVDPLKLLLHWAATRRLRKDILDRYWTPAPAAEIEAAPTNPGTILGGFGAVVAHRKANNVADYDRVVFYRDPGLNITRSDQPPDWPGDATEVLVLEPDPGLDRYGPITPLGQAFVDLWSIPTVASYRFVHTIISELNHDPANHSLLSR